MSMDEQWARDHIGTMPSVGGCGTSYHDERGEVQDCTSVEPCRACLRRRIAQLEARPEWTDLSMTKGPSDPTLAVAYHDGYNDCAARSKAFYEARIAQLEAQRGGAVVVPEYPENSFDVRMAVQKAGGMADFDQGIFRAGWELLASRIQPIPADRVLGPGMVGVDRESIELCIQWYHAVQDLNPAFLDPEDVAAYERIKGFRSAKGEVEG